MPSPNVAEDHQTKNAMALVERGAAIIVEERNAGKQLLEQAMDLVDDPDRSAALSNAIGTLAKPDATAEIVDEVFKAISR